MQIHFLQDPKSFQPHQTGTPYTSGLESEISGGFNPTMSAVPG